MDRIYNGDMYDGGMSGGGRRGVGIGNIQAVREIGAEAEREGMNKMGGALNEFVGALRDRFDYIRRTEAENQMREVSNKLQVDIKEGMAAPYGTAKSLYDGNGMLRREKYESMVTRAQQAGIACGKGIVNPTDRGNWGLKSAMWANNIKAQTQAMLIDDCRQKAVQAYENKYKLSMAGGDFEGAAAAAEEALGSGVINSDQAELDIFRSQKSYMIRTVERMAIDGDTEGVHGMIERGELDKWMTPGEQDALLQRAKQAQKDRAIEAAGRYASGRDNDREVLRAKDVEAGMKADEKKSWVVQGAFTDKQVRLIERKKNGEDISTECAQEAYNEALAVPTTVSYEAWAVGYKKRWGALGMEEGDLNAILKEAQRVREGLEGQRVLAAAELEKAARTKEGILNTRRAANVERIGENDEFEEGSEWRKKYGGQYGITPLDNEDRAKEKYYKAKYNEILDNDFAQVNAAYNMWLKSEEGRKSTPVTQELKYETLYESLTGVKIDLTNNAGAASTDYSKAADVTYKAAVEAQEKRYKEYINGGLIRVDTDNRQYTRIGARGQEIGINQGSEKENGEQVGVYLPEALKSQVKAGKDGVLCWGENGGYRELPVLGFVGGDKMQLSKKAAGVMAINGAKPPKWDWQVVREDEHTRLMGVQSTRAREIEKRAAGERAKRGAVIAPATEGAARRMSQPGYNDLRDSARVRQFMGRMSPYYETFVAAAREYDIDPRLLISIASVESGKGTSRGARAYNNLFGVMDPRAVNPNTGYRGYHRRFRSVEEGIYFTARNLRKNYIDKGYRTIEAIARKYCPPGDPNDVKGQNGMWPSAVGRNYQILSKM